jgi:putative DNA primase/helicase
MNAHGHNISAQSPAAVLPPMIAALLSGTQGQVYLSSVLNEEEWTDDGSDERHVVGRNPKNLIRFIHKWDKPGRSVFFCIGTIQKSKARRIKENIEAMAFASSDVDLKDLGLTRDEALAAINTLKLPPTVIVWSGHGFHLYWLLGAPCLEPGRIEAVNALICETVAGDRAPNHRAALLRVPGTTNSKGGGSEPCEVIRDGGERYTLEQLEAWDQEPVLTRKSAPADAGSNPFLEAAKRLAFKAPIDVQARLAAMEFKGDGDTSIHSTQLSVTAALTIAGWAEDDVVEAVLEATKAAVPGRNWNWVAEEKAIRKMCRDAAEKVESGELGANKTDREPARPNETNDGAPKPKGKAKKTGEFESWDGIEPRNFDWLWKHWLARGELHLIAGAIGAGKTTIALSLAATLTSGGQWPDGSKAAKGRVLFWSGEDSVSKTLIPRFMAMGGDRNRIGGISVVEGGKKRSLDPAADLDILRDELQEARGRGEPISLMVIDPFIVIAKTDSHKNAETRRDMQPLVELAREFDAAVLGVTHYTKGTQKQAVNERVTGSLAFGAQARAIFAAVVQHDEAESDELNGSFSTTPAEDAKLGVSRVDLRAKPAKGSFIRTKSNFGPSGDGFGYEIEPTQVTSAPFTVVECTAIRWGDPVDGAAQNLVDAAEGRKEGGGGGALAEAVKFLTFALANGPRLADEVKDEAAANLISSITLRRARQNLGVEVKKEDGVTHGHWMWSLPTVEVKKPG